MGTSDLVHLVRLQTDNFVYFVANRQTNDKFRLHNEQTKQIRENLLGFRFLFLFETASYIYKYIYVWRPQMDQQQMEKAPVCNMCKIR
jgi:hypothetical protein